MTQEKPRPQISSDQSYIDGITKLLGTRAPLERIPYELITNTLSKLDVNVDVFSILDDSSFSLEEKNEKLWAVVDQSFEAVSRNGLTEEIKEDLYTLWNYLSESDALENADLIYVFGGISESAVREAIRLKKEGYAPKIMFSGKRASYMQDTEMTEAEKYARMATDEGILEEDILREEEAVNTPENVVFSARILRERQELPKAIIAVSLPYHMKRASLTLRAGFDWDFKLIRHPGASAKYTADSYYKDKNGWSYIFLEYLKLYIGQQMKHI